MSEVHLTVGLFYQSVVLRPRGLIVVRDSRMGIEAVEDGGAGVRADLGTAVVDLDQGERCVRQRADA
jgi:hypothetical protein